LQSRPITHPPNDQALTDAMPSGALVWWFDALYYPLRDSNTLLTVITSVGVTISLIPLIIPRYANAIVWLLLWVLQHSLHSAGSQLFYGFGWEIQLLETTIITVALAPLWKIPSTFNPSASSAAANRTPLSILYLYRWLLFRIMIGAGLIKIRG